MFEHISFYVRRCSHVFASFVWMSHNTLLCLSCSGGTFTQRLTADLFQGNERGKAATLLSQTDVLTSVFRLVMLGRIVTLDE